MYYNLKERDHDGYMQTYFPAAFKSLWSTKIIQWLFLSSLLSSKAELPLLIKRKKKLDPFHVSNSSQRQLGALTCQSSAEQTGDIFQMHTASRERIVSASTCWNWTSLNLLTNLSRSKVQRTSEPLLCYN